LAVHHSDSQKRLPELSNSGSLPGKAGGFPVDFKIPFGFPFQATVVSTKVCGYDIHEMLGQKCGHCFSAGAGGICLICIGRLRSPSQRLRQPVSLNRFSIISNWKAALPDGHLADRGFCSDMKQLLRAGIDYDPQQAGEYVKSKMLALLPER
jgi:hypothetical protein